MTKKHLAFETIGFLVTLFLWMLALFAASPWWLLVAMVGSTFVIVGLCHLTLKQEEKT